MSGARKRDPGGTLSLNDFARQDAAIIAELRLKAEECEANN